MSRISERNSRARSPDLIRIVEQSTKPNDAAPRGGTRATLWLICAAACTLFAIAAIRFYFGPTFAPFFNSDAAVPVLLADEILRTGKPLPGTWYFANDEIWTLAPHVFALPFVAVFGVSLPALKLGNLFCLGVMVLFLTLPLQRVTRSWPYSILVGVGVFSVFSGFQEMAVYTQTAYGWFCAQFAILIYLALRMQDDREAEPWRFFGRVPWTMALYALFLVNLTIDSPLRAAVYWVVPVVAICIAFPLSKRHSRPLAVSTVVIFLAAALLHVVISRRLLSQPGTTAQLLQPISAWGTSLWNIARGMPVVVGVANQWPPTLYSALGMLRIPIFAIGAFVVFFAPAGEGPGSAECRFFARTCGAMLLAVLAALIVGRLAFDPSTARYLLPPALLCLAAFMAVAWCRLRTNAYGIAAVAVLFTAAFCGGAVALVGGAARVVVERDCDAPTNLCRLANVLATTGIHQGYSTYWKGNATTLLSHGTIRTCGVWLSPRLAPFRWLVSKECFDQPTEDRFFLAFDRAEIAKVSREFLIGEAGKPDQIVTGDEYEIWIYATANANLEWLRR
jgi:hypothetical protein